MDASLKLVVRFSTSNPDLILTIDDPAATTAISLKQRVRAELSQPAKECRLRLIHAGRVLVDNLALSKSLKYAPPPPPNKAAGGGSNNAKGKQPVGGVRTASTRVYVHCSIGDVLTSSELATEAKEARDADDALNANTRPLLTGDRVPQDPAATQTTTTPAPQGFDRLLNAGFTPAEVATLRTQFLAIQSHTHTPDTMPTGPALLELEERWLDSSNTPANAEGTDSGGFGGEDSAGLDDMLWGNLIGFFWPIGALCWAMREEGIWTRRRQVAVLTGFLVNLTFGFLRIMN